MYLNEFKMEKDVMKSIISSKISEQGSVIIGDRLKKIQDLHIDREICRKIYLEVFEGGEIIYVQDRPDLECVMMYGTPGGINKNSAELTISFDGEIGAEIIKRNSTQIITHHFSHFKLVELIKNLGYTV